MRDWTPSSGKLYLMSRDPAVGRRGVGELVDGATFDVGHVELSGGVLAETADLHGGVEEELRRHAAARLRCGAPDEARAVVAVEIHAEHPLVALPAIAIAADDRAVVALVRVLEHAA